MGFRGLIGFIELMVGFMGFGFRVSWSRSRRLLWDSMNLEGSISSIGLQSHGVYAQGT